jgi:transposase
MNPTLGTWTVIDATQDRLDRAPDSRRIRRRTVEHTFGPVKAWMGATHFLARTEGARHHRDEPPRPGLQSKRVIAIIGARPLIEAMRA